MQQITNAGPLPNTVSGTGTTQKLFGPQLNVPGSLRLDGDPTQIIMGGNINCGVSSTALISLVATYPTLSTGAAQYPFANITNASGNTTGGANIALYNAVNNFVIGQFVNVTNVQSSLNGLVGPLIVANSTAFGGQVAAANVGNVAAVTLTNAAGATIQPINIYNGTVSPALNVGGIAPWFARIYMVGDQQSGIMVAYGTDTIVNINTGNNGPNILFPAQSTGVCTPVPGCNFRNEPVLILQGSVTFGTSNASHNASLKTMYLEN